ncbi:N-acetylmuramoyl-L-alanine amidase [Kitasatospora purpeofusca]|uniref:N-acetylmuramoyl-L-alanine amidase n=1 Tax=Kitasatospora purpeofusca TaxID=67352 RepID=UPI0037F5E72D
MTRTTRRPAGPTAPDRAAPDGTGPDSPGSAGAAPGPDRRPRRSKLLRTVTVIAVLAPLGLAGWLGWRTVGSPDRSVPAVAAAGPGTPAAAPPDGADPTTAFTAAPTGAPTPGTAPGGTADPAFPLPAPSSTALAGRTVLLDPGHNTGNSAHTAEINRKVDIGNARKECDTTGTSTNSGYSEAEYSLDVVHRARAILVARGATVVLVHDGDRPWGPCIDERARIGNAARADAAVSVHGDGGPANGSGFHVIMPAKVVAGKADTAAIVDPSHRLGLLLRDSFHAATGEPYADYVASKGLDTRSDLGGLNLSTVPKVFIECGNMRNPADAHRMTDPQWRQQAAQGIADALTSFLTAR